MKLGVLINSIESLNALLKLPLNVKKAYEISLFVKKLDPEIKAYEEARIAKIKEYGETKDDEIKVKEENIDKFISEISELSEKEIDVAAPELSIDDIGDGKIETKHIVALDWLFTK